VPSWHDWLAPRPPIRRTTPAAMQDCDNPPATHAALPPAAAETNPQTRQQG